MNNLGQFQLFNLSDCNSSQSSKLFRFNRHEMINNTFGDKIINDLRNLANPIEKDMDTNIYSINKLFELNKSLEILEQYSILLNEKNK